MGSAPILSLTVVIPHFNDRIGLRRCLISLAEEAQFESIEVIVVDNGSSALPTAECAPYPFVRLVYEPKPGPGPARSRGARLAGGDIIAFVDCDCRVSTGWARALLGYFETHPATGIVGGDVRIDAANPASFTPTEAYESIYGYRMKLYIERDGYAATCNMAVRRDIFADVGDFGGIDIAEDVDWGRRASARGILIDYVPQMQVRTSARRNFEDLARKWDRHIRHDFSEISSKRGKLCWLGRALALAASPPAEIWRIAHSDRIAGGGARMRAWICLARIRIYRARQMMGLLFGHGESADAAWRGESDESDESEKVDGCELQPNVAQRLDAKVEIP